MRDARERKIEKGALMEHKNKSALSNTLNRK